ncbi:MAG TPA: heavy metal translocating P-type ATPase metal-binding domain-containing protein [Chitinophagales bacterium]|nr:heavy metal translocating P-type ATPase metal-binding domain-containing protein [Chitinophagales bacterium]
MQVGNKVSLGGVTTMCYHCGASCDGHIVASSRVFCCQGCKTVYEVLNDNGLCDFYALNNQPGTSLKATGASARFEYLDDELVQRRLISFSNSNTSRVTFYIPKMHCSSCIYLLENMHRINNAISASLVNFGKREVSISFDHQKISLRQVAEQLAAIGYEPLIQLDSLNNKAANNSLRTYYLKMGVAFFAFGNIMLLSFPEYLGLNALTESVFRNFFGYLNFALALPVLFYCAFEFFSSAYHALRQRTLNMDVPIVLGITAMFIRSTYEVFSHTGAGYFDTLASLILLMLIGRLFQNKTYDSLSFERDYQSYFPVAVTVVNNGIEQQIPLVKLRKHDRILVRNMELIPADTILMKGNANIDYSFVTGEATPVPKKTGDMIYAGGKQVGGAIELEVIKEVSQSYLTQLWNDAAFDKTQKKNISSLATKVSRWFTPLIMVIATGAMVFWWNTDLHRALNAFTSVLIIACPCALALSSPFTLGNVLRMLGRHKIYLKNALTIEKLAQIDTVVLDKTGTLTNTKHARIDFVNQDGQPVELKSEDLKLVKSLVYHSSHPLSKKINELLCDYPRYETENFKEAEGRGIEGWINEQHIKIGSKKYIYGDNYPGVNAESDFRHASKVYVCIDGDVKGFFLVKNEYRKGFSYLLKNLRLRNNVFILSGDNDAERNFLKQYVPENNLQFNRTPGGKLQFIKEQQQQLAQVMMVGDGLNDAGALQQANVGVVISDDVNNFSPACDVILDSSQFENMDRLLTVARNSMTVIKFSFAISLLYNCVGIYFAAQGTMSPIVAAILMPLSSVSIIAFTTLGSAYISNRNLKEIA